ncbi:uncharacterized protein PAC_08200 [Phialocephala subalpina]|uniref:Uncharacterized protein n=1 Tax=Phialocephala subalpina TaxID=576137 RepID=A0A1L7WZW3_9HELO|nr:uncharacterized protein PAC_08200 [Phialocephala subalpina]
MNIVTSVWMMGQPSPLPDFNVEKKCRDFEGLWEWNEQIKVPQELVEKYMGIPLKEKIETLFPAPPELYLAEVEFPEGTHFKRLSSTNVESMQKGSLANLNAHDEAELVQNSTMFSPILHAFIDNLVHAKHLELTLKGGDPPTFEFCRKGWNFFLAHITSAWYACLRTNMVTSITAARPRNFAFRYPKHTCWSIDYPVPKTLSPNPGDAARGRCIVKNLDLQALQRFTRKYAGDGCYDQLASLIAK